jgi:2-iminoacetate synthase ThiH
MPNSRACRFEPAGVARKQHHLRTAFCEQFRNRLTDAHRGACNYCNFSRK